MPIIKIDHVVSFSSEDPVHVANNVLLRDPAKKWKCENAGEKQASIILQLERASVISAIDIGNEHSTYIEVLVSRSTTSDDYKVLLVMSSFMTPLEARQSINPNKVRMFTTDQLSKPECLEKWDRVKIVCTQVFNRRVQYGLSFVTLHSPENRDQVNTSGATTQSTLLGNFVLRPPSPDNLLSSGSLFTRRKDTQSEPLKGAAAIRQASKTDLLRANACPANKLRDSLPKTMKINKTDDNNETKLQPRNKNEILYNVEDEKPNEKIDKLIENKLKEAEIERKFKDDPKPGKVGESSGNKRKNRTNSDNSAKKTRKTVDKRRKPFNELLNGVTLVISGIPNPDRATLRTYAMSLGAKYNANWDNSCTHLVCAFPNTPKFREVKGKGKIVKREWIEDCHSQRKRLPWRRYALDKGDAGQIESEDEIWEEINGSQNLNNDHQDGFDDTKMQAKIDEILTKQKQKSEKIACSIPFDDDTEDECQIVTNSDELSDSLPDFFDGKTFFIDETLDEDVYKIIERYIIAYKGIVADNPLNTVDMIISTEETVDTIKDTNTHSTYLRPDWIWECHNNKKLLPIDGYTL